MSGLKFLSNFDSQMVNNISSQLRGANFITGEEKKENKAEIESVGKSTSPQQVERNKTSYPIKFSPWIIELDRLTNTTTPVLQALPRLIGIIV